TIYTYAYLQYVPKPQERSHLLSENSIYRWDAQGNRGCSNGYGAGGTENESWSAGIYQRDVYDIHTGALDRFFNGITFSINASTFPMPACGLTCLQGSRGDTDQTGFIVDTGGATDVFSSMCKRSVNGTATTQGLWPWPMDARIKAARAKAGLAPLPGD